MKAKQKLNLKLEGDSRFYVYYHTDTNGDIFYIGKGTGNRAYTKSSRSDNWKKIVDSCKEGYGVCFFAIGLTDQESRDLEKSLIKQAVVSR